MKEFKLLPNLAMPVYTIVGALRAAGGRSLIVGGWVRDQVMGISAADVDIEVYGISIDTIEQTLGKLELRFDAIGKSFGILKLKDYDIDISVPRKENRVGVNHTDFTCEFDLDMDPKTAAQRRDFTINSMYWDPLTGELVDHFGGQDDIRTSTLRMTNPQKFGEDSLRVLRAMQFISRFGFRADNALIQECRALQLGYVNISKERVYGEFEKMILKGSRIGQALDFLVECDWIFCFPELEDMLGVEQEPAWHPEGDCFTHIKHCMDAFASLNIIGPNHNDPAARKFNRLVVGFGVLCHDVGKPSTTLKDKDDGRIRALRHDKVGGPIAEKFMRRLTDDADLIEAVRQMTQEHMFTANFLGTQQLTPRSIKRLARRCYAIDLLCYVIQADKEGRPPLVANLDDVVTLRSMAQEMDVYNEPPKPIMMGRHLIEFGLKPGRDFGVILSECQEAEDDGVITDVETGMQFLRDLLARIKRDGLTGLNREQVL